MEKEQIQTENEKTTLEYISKIKTENDALTDGDKQPRRRAFVLTFGCQQNEADSEKIAGMLEAMGYEIKSEADGCDVIVVNTCAIREHAELKALSVIGQYKHQKEQNPSLIIAVCGCMVSQEHRRNDIKFKYPYVDFTFDTTALHTLPKLLYNRLHGGRRVFGESEGGVSTVTEGLPIKRESDYRAWVSVMYGCNNFCTYCIVPYVRGRERSRCPGAVYDEVKALVDGGCRDITLLGQNVNSYGKGNEDGCNFAALLSRLADIDGDYYLRFMTSHPKDASHELIDVMAQKERVAKHFHLPLQSGSDRILKLMNRHYDRAKYLSTVEYMREKIPDIAITTDIIVGFPDETEEDFGETLDMLRTVGFDMIYSFIYSPRKGTPAAASENQIPQEVKSRRFEKLLEVQNGISLSKNLPLIGKTLKVLCDGESKTDKSIYSGRTETNKIVFFDGNPSDRGRFVNIKINDAQAFALYGEKV